MADRIGEGFSLNIGLKRAEKFPTDKTQDLCL